MADIDFIRPRDWYAADFVDEQGNRNANGDYSTTPSTFTVAATGPRPIVIRRIMIAMAFQGVSDTLYYGPIAGGLQTGIRMKAVQDGTEIDLARNEPVKTNFDLAMTATDRPPLPQDERGLFGDVAFISLAWDLRKLARPLVIRAGDMLQLTMADDFTALLRHEFAVTGLRTNRYPS